ncbi:MAG: tandem-95 repeat protein [Fibrobacter sp.]|nr:tandem-95 repeat protein [Fibrobacter sp.]
MMKKMISFGALCALVSTVSAATTVWTEEGPGEKAPAYWYDYTYGTGASIDTSTTAENVKVATMTAKAGNTDNGAGFGFAWEQNSAYKDVPVSLSGYKGMCLTYKSTAPFRVDFKQSTITDDNYYGSELKASSGFKKQFIAFADLKQGWKSATTVTWNITKQIGVQFGFKNTHATTTLNTNTVEIASIILGDKCETKPPVLVGTETGSATLYEGETLDIDLSTIFSDDDGDAVVTALITSGKANASFIKSKTSYEQTDHIYMVAAANTDGSATVFLQADDGENDPVDYTLTVTVVDRENAPVAVNDTYTVKEDSVLKVKVPGLLKNDYDVDDPNSLSPLTLTLVSEPENGMLEMDTNSAGNLNGGFTYTPNPNFAGTDVFTYTLTDEGGLESKTATVTISVTDVNDPMVLVSLDTALFRDTLQLEEDFDPDATDAFEIPATAFVVDDPDGLETVTYGVTSSGIVKAEYSHAAGSHYILFTPTANANGLAKLTFWAKSGKDSVGVNFFVNVLEVKDLPVATDDSYKVVQDSLNKIAKPGVLKNDLNPDSAKATLTAILVENAGEGTVKLAEDGSFTYDAGHYEGLDSFQYVVVNDKGDTSRPATVILTVEHKNLPPQIVEGVADTVGNRLSALTEDFSGVKKYTAAEIKSWFTDDEDTTLTFTARTDDSLLAPTMVSGVLQIRAVKDACGDAEVIVMAADSKGAKKELAIPAKIACVNDRPVFVKYLDSLFVGTEPVWTKAFDLKKWVSDPDGEELKYDVSAIGGADASISMAMDGDNLVLSSLDGVVLEPGAKLYIKVVVSDSLTETAMTFIVFATDAPPASIKPVVAAAPKATWQNAILANRGAVALFDMQGRVMWKAKLPVSEAQVRAAAAQVQGRKILQVNKQTWTIK